MLQTVCSHLILFDQFGGALALGTLTIPAEIYDVVLALILIIYELLLPFV